MPKAPRFDADWLSRKGYRASKSGAVWRKGNLPTDDTGTTRSKGPAKQKTTNVERRARRKIEAKNALEAGAKERLRRIHTPSARYFLVVESHRHTLIDYSNACVKWLEDRIRYWGLIPDDSPTYCDQPIIILVKVPKRHEKTVLRLYQYLP